MTVRVGFTGSQGGMSPVQLDVFRFTLSEVIAEPMRWRSDAIFVDEPPAVPELHHGDCIGSDAQAHDVARSLGMRVVLHPPTNGIKRAFCSADEEREPYDYLVRNKHIVGDSDVIIATPDKPEERRSGTWSTVRAARTSDRPTFIVYLDGTVDKP